MSATRLKIEVTLVEKWIYHFKHRSIILESSRCPGINVSKDVLSKSIVPSSANTVSRRSSMVSTFISNSKKSSPDLTGIMTDQIPEMAF